MKRLATVICIAVATAGAVAACMPKGTPLTPEENLVVQENLAQMRILMAEQLQETLEQRGLRPATAAEIAARRTGNTGQIVDEGFSFSSYDHADGTLEARLVTRRGEFRSAGTWTVRDDGVRCTTIEQLKFRNRGTGKTSWSYSGMWEKTYEMNCYRTYYDGDTEYWILVSGPHYLKSGKAIILLGNPFDL